MPRTDDAIRLACANPTPVWERLLADCEYLPGTGCRLWAGYVDAAGYGVVPIKSPGGGWLGVRAHRLAYALAYGPGALPVGRRGYGVAELVLDHRCRNRACFNPAHVRQLTHGQNLARREYSSTGWWGVAHA